MTPALSFERVTRRYGTLTAVDGLTFDVRPGEMFGLIGPDGAGKTTSIRLLCGLLHADAGAVRVLGVDPVTQHRQITARVGYLSQRFSLYGDLTIDENIAFFAEIHGMSNYAGRRDRLLDMTQLTRFRNRLAEQLSGGMKQKLALACTLVHEPEVILLDEAERCTRVALLDRGRLMAVDTPGSLRSSLAGTMFEVIAPDLEKAQGALAAHGIGAHVFGDRLHAWLPEASGLPGASPALQDRHAAVARFETLLDGARVRVITPSLEDVYIARMTELRP
jgi:ABC-2 type transport system ATP-binding protein